MRKEKDVVKKVSVSVYFDPEVIEKVKLLSKKEHRSISNYIESVVIKAVNQAYVGAIE